MADPPADEKQVRKAVLEAYEKEFHERFFREHLARFGYSDISDFRKNGFNELGKDIYGEYAAALARFDLGLELLVYGFNPQGNRHIFEVANPGKIISHDLRGFAAIGSGAWMALAGLNRKPINAGLSETIWRFLD
jgi:20S proteasome alpha/beta subunit